VPLIHITDPHFNFMSQAKLDLHALRVASEVRRTGAKVVITGDIAEGASLEACMRAWLRVVPDTYFVLGNHDYYGAHIAEVHRTAKQFPGYLDPLAPVRLSDTECLVGVGGGYDFRHGMKERTGIRMADWTEIRDFDVLPHAIHSVCRAFAEASAQAATIKLRAAAKSGFQHIYLATHVPPFATAAWHNDAKSDDAWMPVMTNKALGDALLDFAVESSARVTVLCGHTHTARRVSIGPRLDVVVGSACYGDLRFAHV
jgi:3',5'-cyclic AMP phosphodiesterase CpdA